MVYCARINLTSTDLDYFQKIYFQKSWAWWLNHIGTFVVFLIGICGNILCLIVLRRRPLIRNSYTQYLIVLAIVDTGAILCEALTAFDELYQYQSVGKRIFIQHTILSCKLYYYIRFIFYSMSSWIIVALTIERLVAIRFPFCSKRICTVTHARRIIFFILSFTMFIQSYHFIVKGLDCSSSSISSSTINCRCKTLRNYSTIDIFLTIYVWRLVLMTLLPLTVIITVNILIMNKLFSEKSLIDNTNSSDNAQHKIIVLYKISRMLVVVSSIYLLLHVPGSSLEIIKFMLVHTFEICNMKWLYYISITNDIFDLLTNFNYGINFYLYIISGKHIRTELMRRQPSSPLPTCERNKKFQRSIYFTSFYSSSSKNNQASFHAKLSPGPTGSSV